jgi:hypothetical protein
MNAVGKMKSMFSALGDFLGGFRASAKTRGKFRCEILDVFGNVRDIFDFANATCLSGLDDLLNVYFAGGTQKTTRSPSRPTGTARRVGASGAAAAMAASRPPEPAEAPARPASR